MKNEKDDKYGQGAVQFDVCFILNRFEHGRQL